MRTRCPIYEPVEGIRGDLPQASITRATRLAPRRSFSSSFSFFPSAAFQKNNAADEPQT